MGSLLPSYLFQRNQIWYFRQRVPVELITLFGRKEFKASLKTRDVSVAKRRAIAIASRLWSQFDLLQSEMMKKDNDVFAELITLKDVKLGNSQFGEVVIDHDNDAEKEQATLNAFLNIIDDTKQKDALSQPTAQSQSSVSINTAIGEYIANKRDEVDNDSQADEKTISAIEGKLKRLVELFGNVSVDSLMRKDAEHFRNVLLKLPTNMNKVREYRDLTFTEVLALSPKNTLSRSTVKSYIEVVSTFYKWCKLNQYTQSNPFERLKVKKPKNSKREIEERDPWE